MANNVYIGERYVPIFVGDWDSTMSYEPLMIVQYGNNTYTSKRPVPVGTLPTDTDYWALTGNYNGQIISLQNQVDTLNNSVDPIKGAYVTPEFYGAVGDGTTDDSAAINAALADGRPVVFTTGKTYKCDSFLTINANNKLYGNGCKILFNGGGTLTPTDDLMLADHANNVLIDGFHFELTNPTVLLHCLSFFNSQAFDITNCIFSRFHGTCIRVNADNSFNIRNCRFYNVTGDVGNPGECIFGQTWVNATVENCLCDTIDDHFVYITNNSRNVKIIGCKAIKCGQTTLANIGAAYQIYHDSENIIIDSCSDINCGRSGIQMEQYGPGGVATPKNITIINHSSTNCGSYWCKAFGNGVNNIQNVIISNCCIIDCANDAIRTEEVTGLVINGNIIRVGNSVQISMSNTHKAVISNNYLQGSNQRAIYVGVGDVGASDKIAIKNNIIDGATYRGVEIKMVSEPVQLSGNIMTNSTPLYSSKALVIGDAHLEASKHSITFGDLTDGTPHYTGDVIFNNNPSSGDPVGWICTSGDGEHFGTLKSFGTIE